MKGLMEETRCAKPCRKCGGTERYADGQCKACSRERKRKWREANRENALESERKYREANPEKELERKRKWREANRENLRESYRKYREANPEKLREYWRKCYTQKKFELMTGVILRLGEMRERETNNNNKQKNEI
jgi:hypothetical protein